MILNIYLSKNNFSDSEIANFLSYRFLAVILLSYPLGYFITFRRLKPMFIISSFLMPFIAIALVLSIKLSLSIYLNYLFFIWGIIFVIFQICVLPFIMRYSSDKNQTYCISLSFSTHSIAMLISGLLIFISSNLLNIDEGDILIFLSIIGFGSFYFALKINEVNMHNSTNVVKDRKYDWHLIFQCIFPTLIIAIGAGLTIPFINLFFFHNFNLDSSGFALVGGITSLLIAISSLLVPFLKQKYGFKKSIINTQLYAVIALVLLSSTAYFNELSFMIFFAIFFYMFRAPLMNMAAPLTSELTMSYVGNKNQEMLSAIVAAIWSGSWFFSSKIFKFLIDINFNYSQIFYITSFLYLVGIYLYYKLIKKHEIKNN